MGGGQDVKLLTSRGGRVVLNRGKVISEVSKSLGVDVLKQMEEQLGALTGEEPAGRSPTSLPPAAKEEVIIFR
jgi:hypothetical protein